MQLKQIIHTLQFDHHYVFVVVENLASVVQKDYIGTFQQWQTLILNYILFSLNRRILKLAAAKPRHKPGTGPGPSLTPVGRQHDQFHTFWGWLSVLMFCGSPESKSLLMLHLLE